MRPLEELLDGLKQEYVKSIPDRIRQIQAGLSGHDWACVCKEFHKLKGTGKTYGFERFSELGQLCEEIYLAHYTKTQPAELAIETIHLELNTPNSIRIQQNLDTIKSIHTNVYASVRSPQFAIPKRKTNPKAGE